MMQAILSLGQEIFLLLLLSGGPGKVILVGGEIALLILNLLHHVLFLLVHLLYLVIQTVSDLDLLVIGAAGNSSFLFKLGNNSLHVLLTNEPLGTIQKIV